MIKAYITVYWYMQDIAKTEAKYAGFNNIKDEGGNVSYWTFSGIAEPNKLLKFLYGYSSRHGRINGLRIEIPYWYEKI